MADRQNYSTRYKPLIEKESRIARTSIEANNIYRISTYKYSGGSTKRLLGTEGTLLLVTGIFEGKIYGLKISYLKPETFFKWGEEIVTDKKIFETDERLVSFNKLAPSRNRKGEEIYNQHIKENALIMKPTIPYRTYDRDGIRYISEVFFTKEILESYYG